MDIHCKVRFGEEYRRFVVKSSDFSLLRETVKKLFNLSEGCALKYKDDEGDLVTMSSDEELLSALEFSSGLLHLFVMPPNQTETEFPARNFRGNFQNRHGDHVGFHHPGGPFHGHPGGPFQGHSGHHGHQWEKHGHHWEKHGQNSEKKGWKREKKSEKKWEKKCAKRKCGGVRNPEVLQKRIFWLTKKREDFERRIKELEALLSEGTLPPNLVQEQQFLERKLSGISTRLEKLSLLSSELEASGEQTGDPENLPDLTQPKVELSQEEKDKLLAELTEIRENLYKSCFISMKEAKIKMKFARSAIDNYSGNPESEEAKKLVQEWEASRANFHENKKVLKSVASREKELCDLLGMDKKEWKMKFKMEKRGYKKQCKKKFKHHK